MKDHCIALANPLVIHTDRNGLQEPTFSQSWNQVRSCDRKYLPVGCLKHVRAGKRHPTKGNQHAQRTPRSKRGQVKCDRAKALDSLVFRISTCASHNVVLPWKQMTYHIAMTIFD